MECQRGPDAPRRILLTDQALVAVHLARRHAAAQGRPATSAHLLVGLGTEAEGLAGHVLRRRGAALAALAEGCANPPPGLAPLAEVLAAAADRAAPRPPATSDLLTAALTVGGSDLDDFLGRCGYASTDLWTGLGFGAAVADGPAWRRAETVTLDDPETPRLTVAAARAVGRTRGLAGGAVDLLIALADAGGPEVADLLGDVDPSQLLAARAHLARHHPSAASDAWDTGLEAVLRAAALLAGSGDAGTTDLLQAVLVAGGSGPLAVLDQARRMPGEPDGAA